MYILQFFAIEFVAFASDFVPFAVEFVTFAVELAGNLAAFFLNSDY